MQVALHFVKDEKTRFGLALECGNIEVCYTRGILSVAVHSVVEILTLWLIFSWVKFTKPGNRLVTDYKHSCLQS